MQKSTEQIYFTKAEAADYLRCSLRTIDYLRERNELKTYRFMRKLLFAREDLDHFVKQHRAGADLTRICDEVVAEVLGR